MSETTADGGQPQRERFEVLRDTIEAHENRLAVAAYEQRKAERELERIEQLRPRLALEALSGDEDERAAYARLEAEMVRNQRILDMSRLGMEYGEQLVESHRKELRRRRIAERFGAKILAAETRLGPEGQ